MILCNLSVFHLLCFICCLLVGIFSIFFIYFCVRHLLWTLKQVFLTHSLPIVKSSPAIIQLFSTSYMFGDRKKNSKVFRNFILF
jgi:hypothetical protein